MELFNHYSMLWAGIIIWGVVALFVLRQGYTRKGGITLLVVAVALLAGWLMLRPEPASTAELAQFQAALGQGQATLLELQSPY